MNTFNRKYFWPKLRLFTTLVLCFIFSSCEVDDPEKEEVPELITQIVLRFESNAGGQPILVIATDPDGEGVKDIEIDEPIRLAPLTTYNLSIALINNLADATQPEYDVTEEVREEADEHMFFFGWNGDVFSAPTGSGNIENAIGLVNYLDEDINGLPLGLETQWSTASNSVGELRIILKHQPDLKSEQSDAQTGETDLDVTFPIMVE